MSESEGQVTAAPTVESQLRRFRLDGPSTQLGVILIVAAGLRLWRLNHWSLWYDEVVTMRLAETAGPSALLDLIQQIDATRAPLFPLVLMGWIRVWGVSDIAARGLSALLGVLTVAAVAGMGRSAFDERTGRWAAWFAAVCPTLISYAQEVRMYALLLPLTVVSWWVFLGFRRSARVGHALGYAAILDALIYTHPVGLFMVAAHGLAYLVTWRSLALSPGRWVATLGLAAVGVAPWIGHYLDHPPEYVLPRYPLRFLLSVPIEYIGGNSLTLIPLGALILAGLITVRDRRPTFRDPISGVATACWFAVPPTLLYAYSFVGYSIFGPARIHLFVAPAYFLLVARGLTLLPRWGRLALVVAVLPLTIHGLASRTYAPGVKFDYRAFAHWLRLQGDERPVVVLHTHDPLFPYTQYEAARYYLPPGTELILDQSEEVGPFIPTPHGTTRYDAYCVGPKGQTFPPTETPLATFFGLTITRGR